MPDAGLPKSILISCGLKCPSNFCKQTYIYVLDSKMTSLITSQKDLKKQNKKAF